MRERSYEQRELFSNSNGTGQLYGRFMLFDAFFTNGWLGYLPTAKGFEEGGYEPNTSPFTDKAEQHLTEAVLKVIHGWRLNP